MKKRLIKYLFFNILDQSQLKMRITLLFVLISMTQIYASDGFGQQQKITLNLKKVTLTQAFQQIEEQTDFRFFYNGKDLDVDQKVDLRFEKTPLEQVLNQLFKGKGIVHEILGQQIILKKSEAVAPDQNVQTAQQQRTVKGTITDRQKMPVVGVTVLVEGKQKGTVTNFFGEYSIDLAEGENVLVFSSLGYKTERIEVPQNQTLINLVMTEDLSQLDEVVLIGYGQQKREDVTGAVSSVKTEEIVQSAVGSVGFDRALGGLVKGVQVSQGSGRPGSPVRLNIRGITSPLSGYGLNQPLYVIDGVPFNSDAIGGANPLLTINPNDIERFDILKDAAATSIYGSRGANGVIIIQTKKGKRGQKPSISISTSTTIARPINTVNVLNAGQYRGFYDQMLQTTVNAMNAGEVDPFGAFDLANVGNVDLDFDTFQVSYDGLRDDYFGTDETDWNDYVFRNLAVTQQANFSLMGGSEKNNYSLSLGVIDQEGLTVKDKLKQYTLSMSLDTDE